jgi:hypothetical protein
LALDGVVVHVVSPEWDEGCAAIAVPPDPGRKTSRPQGKISFRFRKRLAHVQEVGPFMNTLGLRIGGESDFSLSMGPSEGSREGVCLCGPNLFFGFRFDRSPLKPGAKGWGSLVSSRGARNQDGVRPGGAQHVRHQFGRGFPVRRQMKTTDDFSMGTQDPDLPG